MARNDIVFLRGPSENKCGICPQLTKAVNRCVGGNTRRKECRNDMYIRAKGISTTAAAGGGSLDGGGSEVDISENLLDLLLFDFLFTRTLHADP